MTDVLPYIFKVSSNNTLAQDTTNGNSGSDVSWDASKSTLTVPNGNYQIQFVADGTSLKTVTSVVVNEQSCNFLIQDATNKSQLDASFKGAWDFTINATDNKNNPWTWDPKIYNDGTTAEPPGTK
ncbi:MAG: hypothetical protein SF066_21855 [Thermoanaerobaculia bacterium]|nr:hypothetical protein [Thermoanaerobaculia bacterium]